MDVSFFDRLMTMSENFWYCLNTSIIGGFGGAIYHLLTSKDNSVRAFMKAIVVSMFVGLTVGLFCSYAHLDVAIACGLSGIFGFAGGISILWFISMVHKKFGINASADMMQLREGILGSVPPETVLANLVCKGKLSLVDCRKMFAGDLTALMHLVQENQLSGEDFGRLSALINVVRESQSAPE